MHRFVLALLVLVSCGGTVDVPPPPDAGVPDGPCLPARDICDGGLE